MARSKNMIVRIQSRDGTQRIELPSTETVKNFLQQVRQKFALGADGWTLYRDRQQKQPIKSSFAALSTTGINHGDMLYLSIPPSATSLAPGPSTSNLESMDDGSSGQGTPPLSTGSTPVMHRKALSNIQEDDIDIFLQNEKGSIDRKPDPKLCSHQGSKTKCVNCLPIDPYDEDYLHKRDIKHMSFHAYLRKLAAGNKIKGTTYPNLDNVSCTIKPGCTGHLPWPKGICTKCQPNAVTLNRQRFRWVDNISFENSGLVERFLNYWRQSGNQRLGVLYGRYEHHVDVPLGIKAVVAAIYEPPQRTTQGSVEFLDDPKQELVQSLAEGLGLHRVGWMFTDLVPEGSGTVKYTRNADTYLLSAEECITAGWFQSQHPNPCRRAPDGYFGSKFVTVVCTGDKNNQVHFEGYQVSNQCAALVRDNCLVPTYDAPELAYVKESSSEQYVPDVYFKEKDQYGNDVSQLGRPLPVEYLIVDVPAGMPVEPQYTFSPTPSGAQPFPVENRMEIGELQNFDTLSEYCRKFSKNQFYEMANDFHFLLYLLSCETYSFTLDQLHPLLTALKERDRLKAFEFVKEERWATFGQMIMAHQPGQAIGGSEEAGGAGSDGASGGIQWECGHCTFHNDPTRADCEMCGLPKGSN